MKKISFLLSIVLVFVACQQNDEFLQNIIDDNNDVVTNVTGISVTEEGHLSFSTESDFENFIKEVLAFENGYESGLRSSFSKPRIAGFVSLSDMTFEQLRSSNSDDEEMTLDEFNAMTANELLIDPVLSAVMDTTLRIEVGGNIFQINEFGTFSAPIHKRTEMEKAIASFDKSLITSTEAGSITELGNDVIFANSFGQGAVEELIEEDDDTPTLRSSSFNNDLHTGYNVATYKWANRSLWQKFWDLMRGKDVTRENNFSSNRRVKVRVFNVNYILYTSAGISVNMQQRKTFLGIGYWTSANADRIAIGINKLQGDITHTNPRSFSSITPTNMTIFQGAVSGTLSNWVYGNYRDWAFAREWTENIIMFMPEVRLVGNTFPNSAMMNSFYNLPADLMYNFLRGQAGRIINPITRQTIQTRDPRFTYLVWGNTVSTFNKDRVYMMGVREYPIQGNSKISSKTVRFNQSFGINLSLNSGVLGGSAFLPTKFNIEEIDCFGAAFYNGQWKGVRFN
jgi:hypothetical protein